MNKLIVVFGLPRTGTTWSFNATKKMLEKKGENFQSGFAHKPSVNWVENPETLLMKTHTPWRMDELSNLVEKGAGKLIMSVRDPGQTVLSQIRVFKSKNKKVYRKQMLERIVSQYDKYEKSLDDFPEFLIIDEWNIEQDPHSICKQINSYCDINNKHVSDVARALSKEQVANFVKNRFDEDADFSEFDEDSHWHAHHIREEPYEVEWKPEEWQLIIEGNVLIEKIKKKRESVERSHPSQSNNLINSYLSA